MSDPKRASVPVRSDVLAVIPARGGSRGVPRKNIRPLASHPLLEFTIAAARASHCIDRLVVSTDDTEIAEVARRCDTEVVQRPAALARDDTPMAPVLQHALEHVESPSGSPYDLILLLQPTTPFRLGADIDAAVARFEEEGDDATSVISVVRVFDSHPARVRRLDGGVLVPFLEEDDGGTRRQDLPPAYLRNGAIYLSPRATIVAGTVWASRQIPYEMPTERSVNIDDPLDFLLAEAILREGLVAPDLLAGTPR